MDMDKLDMMDSGKVADTMYMNRAAQCLILSWRTNRVYAPLAFLQLSGFYKTGSIHPGLVLSDILHYVSLSTSCAHNITGKRQSQGREDVRR